MNLARRKTALTFLFTVWKNLVQQNLVKLLFLKMHFTAAKEKADNKEITDAQETSPKQLNESPCENESQDEGKTNEDNSQS